MIKKIVLLAMVAANLGACSAARPDLKSPCVGAEGSPCDRRPVNNNLG